MNLSLNTSKMHFHITKSPSENLPALSRSTLTAKCPWQLRCGLLLKNGPASASITS